jgi:hypothetical protein
MVGNRCKACVEKGKADSKKYRQKKKEDEEEGNDR